MKEGAVVQYVWVIGELDLVREVGKGFSKEGTADFGCFPNQEKWQAGTRQGNQRWMGTSSDKELKEPENVWSQEHQPAVRCGWRGSQEQAVGRSCGFFQRATESDADV